MLGLAKGLRVLFIVVLVIIAMMVMVIGIPNLIMVATSAGKIISPSEAEATGPYEAILVLGAAVHPDGTPSPILAHRIDEAIELYEHGVAPKIIMSGDDESDQSYDEVQVMKAYAVAHGVPSEDVFCDHAGICTYDSLYRARMVFMVNRLVVVTQSYHLYRALFDARALGIDAVGVPSNRSSYLNQNYYDFREVFARVSDFRKVLLKESSHYLSEPVSLDQSGDVTSW